jgi:hypothetical protein
MGQLDSISMDTLGIIVKSIARYDWIYNLCAAAIAKGKAVRVHFADQGVLLLREFDVRQLAAMARVTVCEKSAREQGLDKAQGAGLRKLLVPFDESAKLIFECKRNVIF